MKKNNAIIITVFISLLFYSCRGNHMKVTLDYYRVGKVGYYFTANFESTGYIGLVREWSSDNSTNSRFMLTYYDPIESKEIAGKIKSIFSKYYSKNEAIYSDNRCLVVLRNGKREIVISYLNENEYLLNDKKVTDEAILQILNYVLKAFNRIENEAQILLLNADDRKKILQDPIFHIGEIK